MLAAGATRTFSENLETSLQLAAAALHEVGEGPEAVQGLLDAFRADYVAAYRPREKPAAGESATPR